MQLAGSWQKVTGQCSAAWTDLHHTLAMLAAGSHGKQFQNRRTGKEMLAEFARQPSV
jgi:hypothetical protein